MDELDEEVDRDEWWLHKSEAECFERVISEVAADLGARSEPSLRDVKFAARLRAILAQDRS